MDINGKNKELVHINGENAPWIYDLIVHLVFAVEGKKWSLETTCDVKEFQNDTIEEDSTTIFVDPHQRASAFGLS